ncbi:MAG: hypothetical protein U0166_07665 [Acidobacteriota bacterium]
MRRAFSRAGLAPALAVLLAAPLLAQVVRVNEIPDQAYLIQAATDSQSTWFVFDNATASCGQVPRVHTRQAGLDGVFLTPESDPYQNCVGVSNDTDVAMLPDGRFLVVREAGTIVLGSRFDATGNLLGPDVDLHGGYVVDSEPHLIATEPDRWTAVWAFKQTGEVWARQVAGDGTMGPKILIDSGGAQTGVLVRIAQLGSGEIVLAWIRPVGGYSDVMTRRYDLNLSPVAPLLVVSQVQASGTQHLTIAASGSQYVVGWDNVDASSNVWTRVRFVDVATGPIGNEIEPNNPGVARPSGPRAAMDGSGRSLLVWHELEQGLWQAWGRWYDPQALPLTPPFRINPSPHEGGFLPDVAMLPTGDAFVAYASQGGQVVFRRFFYPLSLAVAPGPGPGNAAEVRIHRPDGRQGAAFMPFSSQSLGASVGGGQIDLDPSSEILSGPGTSAVFGPHVRGFQPDTTPIAKVSFYAYGTLRFGVKPGAGDVDGDGKDEIVTTPGPGAVFGPHVRGFDYDGAALQAMGKVSFFAFSTLNYGANATAPRLDADGYAELMAAPGPGAAFGAQIKGFDYDGANVTAIGKLNAFAFPSSTHGATVARSDTENDWTGTYGDGYDELFVGRGPASTWDAELRMFDYDGVGLSQTYALTTAYATMYGIEPAGGDVDAGDTGEVVTAPGPDPAAPAEIRAWEWKKAWGGDPLGSELVPIGPDDFAAFTGYTYGGHVAVGTFE